MSTAVRLRPLFLRERIGERGSIKKRGVVDELF